PTEVYFDRHAVFRNFAMYRGEPVPDAALPVAPNILADSTPAVLDWTTQLAPGAHLGKMGAGAMQLTADKAAAVSWAAVKVPRQKLYEVVLRLGDCSPGTGVFLGDDNGKPLHVLGVLHDQRTGQNVLGFLPPNAGAFETNVDLAVQPCSYITSGQW